MRKGQTDVPQRFRERAVASVADIQETGDQKQFIRQERTAQNCLLPDLNAGEESDQNEKEEAVFKTESWLASVDLVPQKTVTDHYVDAEVKLKTETTEARHSSVCMDDVHQPERTVSEAARAVRRDCPDLLTKEDFRHENQMNNTSEVQSSTPYVRKAHPDADYDDTYLPAEGALGAVWDEERDSPSAQFRDSKKQTTRRGALRRTAVIFDPVRIAAPYRITVQILKEKLWMLRHIRSRWKKEKIPKPGTSKGLWSLVREQSPCQDRTDECALYDSSQRMERPTHGRSPWSLS
ncbi:hypothetical protein FJT64_008945 [Amphibalanus amphitrite]|uniref:Uncharacterized protein n=1 Tax=Amphibalanus amphitrite TaxID=1232801 RepID=A0A6A4VP17_AMPAM|nr:hypothetical protein FJT64_008945 [Amphibalanus amphitrite]